MGQLGEFLLLMHKALGSIPSSIGSSTHNLITWKAEVRGPEVQGQSQLQTEFKASLSYIVRPCLK